MEISLEKATKEDIQNFCDDIEKQLNQVNDLHKRIGKDRKDITLRDILDTCFAGINFNTDKWKD